MATTKSYSIGLALKEEGLHLPEECANIQVLMPGDGVIQLSYTINLTIEQIAQVSRAMNKFARLATEAR